MVRASCIQFLRGLDRAGLVGRSRINAPDRGAHLRFSTMRAGIPGRFPGL